MLTTSLKISTGLRKLLTALTLGSTLAAGISVAADATPATMERCSPSRDAKSWMQGRLDKLAERLKLQDSQQAAWKTYSEAVKGMMDHKVGFPPKDADAATLTRFHAEASAERAKKAAAIADATAKLQDVLNDDQRKVLADSFQRAMRGPHHHPPMM